MVLQPYELPSLRVGQPARGYSAHGVSGPGYLALGYAARKYPASGFSDWNVDSPAWMYPIRKLRKNLNFMFPLSTLMD